MYDTFDIIFSNSLGAWGYGSRLNRTYKPQVKIIKNPNYYFFAISTGYSSNYHCDPHSEGLKTNGPNSVERFTVI